LRECGDDIQIQVTHTAYDPQGRVVATWGATYPVAYEYDHHGRMTAMATTRNETADFAALAAQLQSGQSLVSLGSTWSLDLTQWTYDPATGLLLQKLYADGKGPTYTYTADGKLATRAWAREIEVENVMVPVTTTYAYDLTGALVSVSYNDGTPGVAYTHDHLGRPVTVTDALGTRTFAYDANTLQLISETLPAGRP
jgi:YD repeat-containing protein